MEKKSIGMNVDKFFYPGFGLTRPLLGPFICWSCKRAIYAHRIIQLTRDNNAKIIRFRSMFADARMVLNECGSRRTIEAISYFATTQRLKIEISLAKLIYVNNYVG